MKLYPIALITGGTGTFGLSYTCISIEKQHHDKIVIFSRDEYKQLKMSKFLAQKYSNLLVAKNGINLDLKNTKIRFIIGDVQNSDRLLTALKNVDVCIHSAALKHIDIAEHNPLETININVNGTINVIKACAANEVRKVIALSSDKACQPINLYGCSKLCLEKIVLGGKKYYHNSTQFSVVRYGNILSSRGSLIDLISKDQVSYITEPEMTRFWLTIEEGVNLVKTAIEKGSGSDIFIPKLKMLSIGKVFEYLCPNRKFETLGFRTGEKKHEMMVSEHELNNTFDVKTHFVINANGNNPWLNKYPKIKLRQYTSDVVEEFTKEEFLEKVNGSIINEINKIF